MDCRRVLTGLLLTAIVMPIADILVLGLGRLLAAMGDQAGAAVLDRIALAGGLLWVVSLVLLLLTLGFRAVLDADVRVARFTRACDAAANTDPSTPFVGPQGVPPENAVNNPPH